MTAPKLGRPEKLYAFRGGLISLPALAKAFGIKRTTLLERLKRGVPIERAIKKERVRKHEIHNNLDTLPDTD